jgi:iron complex outermembrane receptor protein
VYLASAKYKITPDVMVYALTGSSWRPGPRAVGNFSVGPTGTEGPSAREEQFMNLPPERSKSYEIGAKTSFLNGRGSFNISAYYQDFENYPYRGPASSYVTYGQVTTGGIATVRPSVGSFNFVSPVPVTVKGVEAEASYQILDRWSIGANASYADGKIKDGTVACTDLNGDGVPDQNVATPTLAELQSSLPPGENLAVCPGFNGPAATTPKFSANIQSEYGFDIGDTMDAFVRGSATIFGNTKGDPNNTFDNVGAYGLLNLFAGLRGDDGAWEITVFSKNILNERQVLNVGSGVLSTTYRNGVGQAQTPFRSEYRSVAVTAPREFGISARVALGSR